VPKSSWKSGPEGKGLVSKVACGKDALPGEEKKTNSSPRAKKNWETSLSKKRGGQGSHLLSSGKRQGKLINGGKVIAKGERKPVVVGRAKKSPFGRHDYGKEIVLREERRP